MSNELIRDDIKGKIEVIGDKVSVNKELFESIVSGANDLAISIRDWQTSDYYYEILGLLKEKEE